MVNYKIKRGDTPENEIRTGCVSLIKVNGKFVKREFNVVICEYCKAEIKPVYITSRHGYSLITDKNHNKKRFCSHDHASGNKKAKKSPNPSGRRSCTGFSYTKPTQRQTDAFERRLLSLI